MPPRRVAITGMAALTPLGDRLDAFLAALLAGRSALSRWKGFAGEPLLAKVGGDLSDYDIAGAVAALGEALPPEMAKRLRALVRRAAWSCRLSLLVAARAWLDAGRPPYPDLAVLVSGHNINSGYAHQNARRYQENPGRVDPLFAVHYLDTDHAGCVSELLAARGAICTVGGACASGNLALRAAIDEVRHHGAEAALVVGPAFDFSAVDVQAMALMGAVPVGTFDDEPAKASRPFDVRREGFVPAHGAAALFVENLDAARRRGARIHAEVLAVAAGADANHLPQPSPEGQARVLRRAIEESGLRPERVDHVSAHATSTPAGDLSEVQAIREVFGDHAGCLTVNAPKSMLGHTCWSAAVVETVALVLQMQAGRLHPSINVDELDPGVDFDVCRTGAVDRPVRYAVKNAFGFGGINGVSVLGRYDS